MAERNTKHSESELFKDLRAHLAKKDETPEDGYFTTHQWAEKSGMTRLAASEVIREGVKQGFVDMQMFRSGGKKKPHYRIRGPLLRAKVKQ